MKIKNSYVYDVETNMLVNLQELDSSYTADDWFDGIDVEDVWVEMSYKTIPEKTNIEDMAEDESSEEDPGFYFGNEYFI